MKLTYSQLLAIGFTFCSTFLFSQNASLSGQLLDETGETIIGGTIFLEGTTKGSATDYDGNYMIENIAAGTYEVIFSFIGYKTITESITFAEGESVQRNLTMISDAMLLDEAVVIGFGKTYSKDLTGSTKMITSKDFTDGNVTTPEQLIMGKATGVQITSNNGAPGSGSRIRIRGGSSLNASNAPLIVIDGVPLDNEKLDGAADPLNLINPNEIENIVVLKDASAAAIYGSRGANGVILITTKKGQEGATKLSTNIQQNISFAQVTRTAEVMNADELRNAITEFGTPEQLALLGNSNTDWQEEIYQNAIIAETNASITGGIKQLPYRFSIGYKNEEGILKTHELERTALGLNLTPKLFDNYLAVEANAKYTISSNFFANQDAIGSAVRFDPTQPVNSGNAEFGGYFEWLNPQTGEPNNLSADNPVGLIFQKEDISDVTRFIGNVKLDLTVPMFTDLHLIANVGGDFANSEGSVTIPAEAASKFLQGGERSQYEQDKNNRLLETYFNYTKKINAINLDVTGGYSYQRWQREKPAFPLLNIANDTVRAAGLEEFTENVLISYFGRVQLGILDKYLITGTLRRDGSSRFNPEQRWGLFPSVAVAWRVSEEGFLKNVETLSYLKLRAGFGVTGQQDIVDNDYPYLANYTNSTSTAQYQFGDQFYGLLRPDGFDFNIKWEETTSTNFGIDFGLFKDRVFGAVDYYFKKTDDLLAIVDVPAGANFTNEILTNIGSMNNQGIEAELNFVVLNKPKSNLTLGINMSANTNEITKLTRVPDTSSVGILLEGIDGGIGNNVQIHAVGYPANSFYVYEQLYDDAGKPLEGQFADRNGDEIINEKDRYIYEKINPDLFAGFNANFTHNRWSAGFSMRGEFGRYVYNNVNSSRAWFNNIPAEDFIDNLHSSFNNTEFITSSPEQFLSDYYVEKADFVRMDYFSIGYNLGKVFKEKLGVRLGLSVNNVFVISNYSGIDPEIPNGVDKNIYPRPRIYSLNVNLSL